MERNKYHAIRTHSHTHTYIYIPFNLFLRSRLFNAVPGAPAFAALSPTTLCRLLSFLFRCRFVAWRILPSYIMRICPTYLALTSFPSISSTLYRIPIHPFTYQTWQVFEPSFYSMLYLIPRNPFPHTYLICPSYHSIHRVHVQFKLTNKKNKSRKFESRTCFSSFLILLLKERNFIRYHTYSWYCTFVVFVFLTA